MTRTPEERERMMAILWKVERPNTTPWIEQPDWVHEQWGERFDGLLAFAPELWNHLPPDPAEQARKEAERDTMTVDGWRVIAKQATEHVDRYWATAAVDMVDRMTARAAAGYPVLIAPKGDDHA